MTSSLRYKSVRETRFLDTEPLPSGLIQKLNYKAGRNHTGRVTSRHKGGRHKRRYRLIDFKRDKNGVIGNVVSIHYDPNRSADIALISYQDGDKRLILAPDGLKKDQEILASDKAPIRPGNCLPLKNIPPGSVLHNIEMHAGKGGQIARSAGTAAVLAGQSSPYVLLKMPSGEMRKIHQDCRAVIGQVGNQEHNRVKIGKAGRNRWKGKRPHTRGVAMNPVDHPLGGGEGKSSGGRHPCTPWGKPTKGYKTRKKNKKSDRFIVQKRTVRKKTG